MSDGHILPACRASTLCPQEALVHIPVGIQSRCEDSLRAQDLFHVRFSQCYERLAHFTKSFVAILFADALQRMFRVTAEADMAKQSKSGAVQDIRTDTSIAARKF